MKKLVLLAAMAIASMSMFAGAYSIRHTYDPSQGVLPYAEKVYKIGQLQGWVKMYSRVEALGNATKTVAKVYTSTQTLLYCIVKSELAVPRDFNYARETVYMSEARGAYVGLTVKIPQDEWGYGEAFVGVDY